MGRVIVLTTQSAPISEQLGLVLAAARLRGDDVVFYDIEKARPKLAEPMVVIQDEPVDLESVAATIAAMWSVPGPGLPGFSYSLGSSGKWHRVKAMEPKLAEFCMAYNVGEPPDYKRSPAQHARQYIGTGRKTGSPNGLLQRLMRKLK